MSTAENQPKAFFAYAGGPPLRAEATRESLVAVGRWGIDAEGWEALCVGGKILIDAICDGIEKADACVAEVSSMNPNVLFEAGYAIALGKSLYLALDETDEDANRAWSGLAMLDTIGRLNYGGNSERLAEQVASHMSEDPLPLIDALLAGGRPKEANAIFAPAVPHKFNAADRLERLLERKTHLRLLASQDDLALAGLRYYVHEIYRSSAAVMHFMAPSRVRAQGHNARLSLLAGIAHGLKIPLLMVAESGFQTPLDYKDLLFVYSSTAQLTERVETWLASLPTPQGSNRRLGRLNLDIELPIRTFGQFVAESEAESLSDYFVHTNEFEAVLTGRAQVFLGRKGTGKSANMLQSVEELRKDRRVLVVPIKPSSYDLAALVGTVARFEDTSKRDYFLLNLWTFLLLTEMAIRALAHADRQPAGYGGDPNLAELAETVAQMGVDREGDMSSRLDDVISKCANEGQELRVASDTLRQNSGQRLQPVLRRALHNYEHVAVLIDNLDKTWEKGVDYENLSHFLLSLLVTAGRIKSDFEKFTKDKPSVAVTLTVFLRTDIYDVMTKYAREPDKINPQTIQWHDEELLIRVLEDRYAANRKRRSSDAERELWSELFCPEVHGLPTRDYFLWRALPRPRDIVFLGNAALTTAIDRRHSEVLAQDFAFAEKVYSRFAVEALIVESEAQGFDLEEILFEFAGLDATISTADLTSVLSSTTDPAAIERWLVRTSFLGLETRDGSFVHVEGESEARKKLKAANRLSTRMERELRYRVHPAFRPYLDIGDDDLLLEDGAHVPENNATQIDS